jgi:hypothetical protein
MHYAGEVKAEKTKAALEARDRQARRAALRGLKGRVRFELDLERTRR